MESWDKERTSGKTGELNKVGIIAFKECANYWASLLAQLVKNPLAMKCHHPSTSMIILV